ncbi:MAG TPA: YciI family protein [Bacteroidia bacterium]|nr:YciI family protein [Bacteroidia bacterium]
MEKFMYLFRGGENHAHNAQDSEAAQKNMQAWGAWMGDLAKKGIMVGADPLQPTGKVVSGTKKVVTDGPFVEAKEMVGGYLIVNANNIDEAVEFSKGCPIFAENGKVEVRPLQKMEM